MLTSDTDTTEQTTRPAETSADAVTRLEDENLQLKQAVRSHAVVDQAIGVILAVGQRTPDEGWDTLRAISQNTNIKLRHVAELIVDWARTGELPAEIRGELERRLGLDGTRDER